MKYEILHDHAMVVDGGRITCYRIRALRDIPRHNVKAGDVGGWIESEYNLSQDGDAWVRDGICVFGLIRIESAGVTDKGGA